MTRWIHGISADLLRAAFREYFGVSEEHADILIVLYGRPGEWVTTRKLQVLLNSHRPPRRGTVHERIRVLREIMEAESLVSGGQLDDLGYTLTEVGFAECHQALRSMADVLMRAGPDAAIPPVEPDELDRIEQSRPRLPAPSSDEDSPPLRNRRRAA